MFGKSISDKSPDLSPKLAIVLTGKEKYFIVSDSNINSRLCFSHTCMSYLVVLTLKHYNNEIWKQKGKIQKDLNI